MGDLGSIPGLERSPGEGNGYPPQYSGLENSMDCIAYGVTKSWTRLSEFHILYVGFAGGASGKEPACQCRRSKRLGVRSLGQKEPLEEGMATHSSILA